MAVDPGQDVPPLGETWSGPGFDRRSRRRERGLNRRSAIGDPDPGSERVPDGPPAAGWQQSLQWFRDPVGYMERGRESYGPVFRARLGPSGRVAMISDPELIRQVLDARPDEVRMGDANGLMRPVVGPTSMLVLDDAEHLRHRRILLPMFRGPSLPPYMELIHDVACEQLDALPSAGRVEMREVFDRIALGVIFAVMLGPADERRPRLIAAFESAMRLASSPFTLLPQFRRKLGGLTPYGRLMRRLAALDELYALEIAERRADPGVGERDDVLSRMVAARDARGRGLTDTELRDELMTMLMAGHETSAAGLSWTIERLRCNPGSLERLHASADGADEQAFVDAFIRESLRMRPVVPVLVRKLQVPAHLGDYSLPPGWIAMLSVLLAHREPSEYPEPERFDPARFLPPVTELPLWIPFGGGIRRCLGMGVAELEIQIVLREFLRRYTLAGDDTEPSRVRRERFILVPHDNAVCTLAPR